MPPHASITIPPLSPSGFSSSLSCCLLRASCSCCHTFDRLAPSGTLTPASCSPASPAPPPPAAAPAAAAGRRSKKALCRCLEAVMSSKGFTSAARRLVPLWLLPSPPLLPAGWGVTASAPAPAAAASSAGVRAGLSSPENRAAGVTAAAAAAGVVTGCPGVCCCAPAALTGAGSLLLLFLGVANSPACRIAAGPGPCWRGVQLLSAAAAAAVAGLFGVAAAALELPNSAARDLEPLATPAAKGAELLCPLAAGVTSAEGVGCVGVSLMLKRGFFFDAAAFWCGVLAARPPGVLWRCDAVLYKMLLCFCCCLADAGAVGGCRAAAGGTSCCDCWCWWAVVGCRRFASSLLLLLLFSTAAAVAGTCASKQSRCCALSKFEGPGMG